MFNIELGIKVTKLPVETWTNIFHFSANGDNEKYGDRIPALYIHKSGYFQVCSAVNDTSYCKSINFEPAKHYQMAIIQYKASQKFWFVIIVNDEVQLLTQNTHARSFLNVKLYASDPWTASFSSNWGSICNFNMDNIGNCFPPITRSLHRSHLNNGCIHISIFHLSEPRMDVLKVHTVSQYCTRHFSNFGA